tara:strand:+ start:4971 stop:5867 length:897 start_codon:yes stop_codon:yes gene_type:complete
MYNRKEKDPYHVDNFSLRFLYQIFYQFNKFDNVEDIVKLDSYMYKYDSSESLKNLFNSDDIKENSETYLESNIPKHLEEIDSKKEKKSNYFIPRQSDTLFWCIFYEIYGEKEYLQIGDRYSNREIKEKQNIIQYFRNSDVKMLKNSNQKITNGEVQEIMSEFMCIQNKTSLLGLIGLVVYYKRSIYLVHSSKNIFIKFGLNDDDDPIILEYMYNDDNRHKCKYKLFIMNRDEKEHYIKDLQNSKYEFHQYNKPLTGLSTYKTDDLRNILYKMNIDSCGKKKNEMYQDIMRYCVWDKSI